MKIKSAGEVRGMDRCETPREKTCCFTGHRSSKLPWGANESDPRCIRLKASLADAVEAVYAEGVRHFICGMAEGCDTFFGEAVAELRRSRPDVTLEAAVPCEEQDLRWSPERTERYDRLLAECDKRTLVSRHYTPDCMMRRNRYMVDRSCVVIAVFNGSAGGTFNTLRYAIASGLKIIEIDP